MIFYHWTTKENWKTIKKEWVLWGKRYIEWKEISRCTYLAVDKKDCMVWFLWAKPEIILEVEYTPNDWDDNYFEWCRQCRVYVPIKQIKLTKQRLFI
jgi:hypothetical protein